MMNNGIFTISLDFELYWGVRDKRTIEEYEANLLGVQVVIPKILSLFEYYDTHATWATVGFLMAKNVEELKKFIPADKPSYINNNLSPYKYLENTSFNEYDEQFLFSKNILTKIKELNTQEIATHTFSHFYCMENGQNEKEFHSDIVAAIKIAKKLFGIETKSIIFPRNQLNKNYLQILSDEGILAYRGNPNNWIYNSGDDEEQKNIVKRALRLLDNYINLTGYKTYSINSDESLLNIPSSLFLRPYNKKMKLLESLRLRRIKKSMLYAAKNKKIFHLWWHPHNFGVDQNENLAFLERILKYYQYLEKKYAMTSLNMEEIVELKEGLS